MLKNIPLSLSGGLAGLLYNQQDIKEGFNNGGAVVGVVVVFAIVFIVLTIMLVVASYRIMNNSVLHAILTLVFGMFYVWLLWLWAGFSGKRFCY